MKTLTGSRLVFLFAAIVIISTVAIITALSLYNNIESLLIEEKGKKAMSVSIAVEKLIEQDYGSFRKLLETSNYSHGNYDAVYYDKMQKTFREIREKTGVKYLYCGKRVSESGMIYLFDGEPPESEFYSPLGSVDNLDQNEQVIYQSKTSGYTPIVNDYDWGELLTGMTPILDPETGEAVAHVGVDVSVQSVHTSLQNVKRAIMFNAFIFTVIASLIIYRLLCMPSIFTENDYLTGLHSKGYQDRFLNQLIKKSTGSGKQFPLIMIDFDDFKIINDEYGHQFGDAVLKAVSEIIRICTRSVDCCARYGGDEFVIILPEANLEYGSLVCQWLQKEVCGLQLSTRSGVIVPVSISIGIAIWEPNLTSDQILIRADKALYQSKRTGKNRTVIYTDDLA